MDHQFCPGARILRQPQPEIFDCPSCGEEVEIWTDEIRGVCSNCDRAVFRDGTLSCLEWCKFAQECLGEEAYDRYMRNRAVGLRRRLLEAVRELLDRDRLRQAEAVLSWSEKILEKEKADWHIVIPASILQNIDDGTKTGGFQAAREILVRSGLTREDIEKIRRIVERDPAEKSAEFDVVHDARLLARLDAQGTAAQGPVARETADGALRTGAGKTLAVAYSAGGR